MEATKKVEVDHNAPVVEKKTDLDSLLDEMFASNEGRVQLKSAITTQTTQDQLQKIVLLAT